MIKKYFFILITTTLLIDFSCVCYAQDAGFFGTPLSSINYNGESIEASAFNGSNLGEITSLTLNGAVIRTFKNNGANVSGAFITYRIYATSESPGLFNELQIPFSGDTGGGNQIWQTSNELINLINGLSAGNYKFEVFFKITTSNGDRFQSNDSNNYIADFSLPYRSSISSNWSNNNAWIGNISPISGSSVFINHNINLDTNISLSKIEINSSQNLNVNTNQTLTITGGISGAGGLFVNGNFQIDAGGFSSITPTYTNGSTLIFQTNGPYNIDSNAALWASGNTTGSGVPDNVTVTTTNPLNIFGARDVPGNLTINAGASVVQGNNALIIQGNLDNSGNYAFVNNGANLLTIEGDLNNQSGGIFSLSNSIGGDLHIRGNWDNAGTFNANNRAIFFNGTNPQTIANSQIDGIAIPFLFIQNHVTALSNLTVSNLLEYDVDNALILNGTLTYGETSSRLRIVGGTNFETTDAIFPITNGPKDFEINHNGTVTLHDSRVLDGDISVSSGNLIIKEGTAFTAANVDNAGTITLNSTSALYSSLIPTSVTNIGTITYKRFTNAIGSGTSGGNDLVAAPLSGQSVADFVTANPNLAQNGDNSQVAFAIFDHTNGSYDNYTPNSSAMLSAGTGYRAATTGGGTLAYTGAVATGPITTSISAAASVWNLIGNPYPSYISSADFLSAANTGLLDPAATAIYGYNDGTYSGTGDTVGNFTIINNNSNSGLNIAPGQGFFVASNADGGAITFTPAMRTAIGADDFILGRSTAPNYYLLLELHSNAIYRTSFYFNENSTLGLDPGYDAAVFGNNSTNYPIYSHLVEDHTGRPMAMQSLNDTDLSNVTIALGVNANAGEQLSFSIGESSLPHTVNVYLEDTATNTYTLLNTGDYTLTPNSALNGVGRFYLRFGDTALSAADATLENVTLYTNQKAKTIVIAGQLLESTTAFIYDIQGRLVVTQHLDPKLRLNQVDVTSLRQGIYIVALRSKAQNKSLKVILN